MHFDSIDKVLNYAIQKEQEAADFYTDLAGKMDKQYMKDVFQEFAVEEKSHKMKLEKVKEGKLELPTPQKISDLKIAEVLVDVNTGEQSDYQQALITAMKTEKAAFKLYNDLAEMTENAEVRQLFLSLAQEEAKHKLRFEIEYDDNILSEN